MNSRHNSAAEKLDADIAVIGGGGTGMAAAVTAAEKGAEVILLEKRGSPGGNSAMAVGIFAAESPTQKRMSISAPKDEVFKVAMEYSHWRINPRIFRAFVDKSGDTIQWLEDLGLKFTRVPSMFPGQAIRTWHCIDELKPTGPALIKCLRKHCKTLGVRLLTKCPAKKILTDKKGKVKGVLAEMNGKKLRINAKGVIMGTGGYGGNKELLKKYFPNYSENMLYIGAPNMGDGFLMATEIGAAVEGMGTLMLHPHAYQGPVHINAIILQPYLIWSNQNGERFADESITFHHIECGNAINRQPDKCVFAIFDEGLKNRAMQEGVLTLGLRETGVFAGSKLERLDKELRAEADKGMIKISDSLDEIDKWVGASPNKLKSMIEEYNTFCDHGHDKAFAKDRRYLQALHTPPYYAIKCHLSFLTTLGGVKINHRMEVLDTQDKPIPGLYAGGDVAGDWTADTYCMYLAGNAFSFAVNSGRIAAENARKYVSGV